MPTDVRMSRLSHYLNHFIYLVHKRTMAPSTGDVQYIKIIFLLGVPRL